MTAQDPLYNRWRRESLFIGAGVAVAGLVVLLVAVPATWMEFQGAPAETRMSDPWAWGPLAMALLAVPLLPLIGYALAADVLRRQPIPPGTRVQPSVPVLYSGGNVLFVIVMGLGGSAFFAGAGALSWIYVDESPLNAILLAGWGLAAAGTFGYMIYDGLRQYRYGPTMLRLHGPAAVGRELSAELVLPKAPEDLKELTVVLTCESTRWYLGKGSKNSINVRADNEVPFADERKFPVTRLGEGARCPIRMPIPAGLPASDPDEVLLNHERFAEFGSVYHSWSLAITGEVAGADLNVSFRLAVQPR